MVSINMTKTEPKPAQGVVLDADRLEQLLVDGKFDDAKKMLNEYLSADLSKEEKGAIYVAFVMTYVSVMNKVYDQYNEALDETISNLNFIDQTKKEVNEKIDLARIKNEAKKLAK